MAIVPHTHLDTSDKYDGKCCIDEGDGYVEPVALLCAKVAQQTSI